jgi:hypothetical protein
MYKKLITISVALLFPVYLLAADNQQVPKLLNAETLKCFFETGYTTTYDNGKLSDTEKSKNPFGEESIVFDSIDLQKGTARLVGNNGASSLAVSNTAGSINFIEVTPTNNVNLITVFAATEETTDKYVAVFSRHINKLLGEPIISQFFGSCKILEGH